MCSPRHKSIKWLPGAQWPPGGALYDQPVRMGRTNRFNQISSRTLKKVGPALVNRLDQLTAHVILPATLSAFLRCLRQLCGVSDWLLRSRCPCATTHRLCASAKFCWRCADIAWASSRRLISCVSPTSLSSRAPAGSQAVPLCRCVPEPSPGP